MSMTERQQAVANMFRLEIWANPDGTYSWSAMTGNGEAATEDDARKAFLATLLVDA